LCKESVRSEEAFSLFQTFEVIQIKRISESD